MVDKIAEAQRRPCWREREKSAPRGTRRMKRNCPNDDSETRTTQRRRESLDPFHLRISLCSTYVPLRAWPKLLFNDKHTRLHFLGCLFSCHRSRGSPTPALTGVNALMTTHQSWEAFRGGTQLSRTFRQRLDQIYCIYVLHDPLFLPCRYI